jgi:predicted HAD superfamily phosphohydrolase YqeG
MRPSAESEQEASPDDEPPGGPIGCGTATRLDQRRSTLSAMLGRVPMHVAHDLDTVERLVGADPEPSVVILDADNTLVPQGVGLADFRKGVTDAVDRFNHHPSVTRVIVLTNGPERGVPGMIHRGNKPWTTRRRLGLGSREYHVWVVGDQVLTDGVLAWRLGATFVHLAIDEDREEARQAMMRRIGRRLGRLLFRH